MILIREAGHYPGNTGDRGLHFKNLSRIEKHVNPWLLIPHSESGSYFYLQASVDFPNKTLTLKLRAAKRPHPTSTLSISTIQMQSTKDTLRTPSSEVTPGPWHSLSERG